MQIENREIIKTEKNIIVVKNDEDLKFNTKMYGTKRFIEEREKARDKIESSTEFKELIESLKNEGNTVIRQRGDLVSEEDYDKYVQTYIIK